MGAIMSYERFEAEWAAKLAIMRENARPDASRQAQIDAENGAKRHIKRRGAHLNPLGERKRRVTTA